MRLPTRLAVLITFVTASMALADKADPASQSVFDRLVQAIQANDRAKFLENSTEEMAAALTPEVMTSLSEGLAAHIKAGFDATYLTDLKQQGYVVKLWKVTFKDGSDDVVLRIAMKGDKLAGFYRQ